MCAWGVLASTSISIAGANLLTNGKTSVSLYRGKNAQSVRIGVHSGNGGVPEIGVRHQHTARAHPRSGRCSTAATRGKQNGLAVLVEGRAPFTVKMLLLLVFAAFPRCRK